ncbi:MAG: hypothetical protein IKX47_08565, partial [Oscillospiraceae bacterium]|nr:hypothetical protein [Oscillospiraceae bacterium]
MVKKALALVFVLLFVLALFSGCGQKTPAPASTAAPTDNSGGQAQSTPAPTAKATQAPAQATQAPAA